MKSKLNHFILSIVVLLSGCATSYDPTPKVNETDVSSQLSNSNQDQASVVLRVRAFELVPHADQEAPLESSNVYSEIPLNSQSDVGVERVLTKAATLISQNDFLQKVIPGKPTILKQFTVSSQIEELLPSRVVLKEVKDGWELKMVANTLARDLISIRGELILHTEPNSSNVLLRHVRQVTLRHGQAAVVGAAKMPAANGRSDRHFVVVVMAIAERSI